VDESEILMDYTPPAWREWLFEILNYGVEYILLVAVFGALGALGGEHVYQSPLGPVPLGSLVPFGFMLMLLILTMRRAFHRIEITGPAVPQVRVSRTHTEDRRR
jgi:hypothetical protein